MDVPIGRGFPKENQIVAEFTIPSAATTNLGITEYERDRIGVYLVYAIPAT